MRAKWMFRGFNDFPFARKIVLEKFGHKNIYGFLVHTILDNRENIIYFL